MMKFLCTLQAIVCCVVIASTRAQPGKTACVPGGGYDHFPFCNTSLSIDDRVRDLLGRIPDETKPNLLTARGGPHGQQSYPDLGVPAYYWGSNCIHSSMFNRCTDTGRCSTSFPSGPSWAATFDRALMKSMAAVIAKEQRAAFNMGNFSDNGSEGLGLECWGPVINLNRDPRWGRNGEGGAEDPYLMGQLGMAWTEGLQNGKDSRYLQVAVTLKHYDANSLESSDGFTRHTVDASISKYVLSDYYWKQFKAAIRDSNAKGVMCSYNSVNGVPTCGDPLMKAARDAWNFTGYVTSDSDAVADIYRTHGFVKTAEEASCIAIRDGGCDVNSGNTYYSSLLEGVSQGHCTMDDVDAAVAHTLKLRFEMGLFDPVEGQTYWSYGKNDIGTDDDIALNLEAAQESLVLVRNPTHARASSDNSSGAILPLTAGKKIAVIGPHGNATFSLIQIDTGIICPDKSMGCVKTPFDAIKDINDAQGGTTTFVQGCDLLFNGSTGFADAVTAAKNADYVVLALGITSCGNWGRASGIPENLQHCASNVPEYGYVEAEAHDRTYIDLPPVQHALAQAVLAVGTPTVLFTLNGGMVSVEHELAHATNPPAYIEAFYPGMEGAKALATSMFGQVNKWGRMPYTVYHADWINDNSMLDHDITHKRTYRYGADAVVPFGYGLSYTTFALGSSPSVSANELYTDDLTTDIVISVNVSNTGNKNGDVVLMAYMVPTKILLPQYPIKSLFDFERVSSIAAQSTITATFHVDIKDLLLATETGDLVAEPGEYTVVIDDGSGSSAGSVSVPITIIGRRTVVEPFPQP
eukprot:m.760704 g.760704  ORF g.760704 m.760704 type:complete len:805 (-) comp23202_c0_seq2:335-2749(-)